MKKLISYLLFCLVCFPLWAAHQPEFSTAGFFRLKDSGREVYSMNPAWRFYKGAVTGAENKSFDDKNWTVVSLPNGIEYLPTEASGCINYQGEVWYRKHFTPEASLKGKKLFLHFEAIMGKCKVYVNGKLLTEHFGGYLPIVVDVTNHLDWNNDNVIAVWADNSDDPTYPPGKPQDVLDFSYFGGIYRDCWLIAHNNIYITDPNYENEVAGGGLFVAYDKVSEASANILLKVQVRNAEKKVFAGTVEYELIQPNGEQVTLVNNKMQVKAGTATTKSDKITLKNPLLWSPSSPSLYNLIVRIRDKKGNVVDGYRRRIGIRSIEFKAKDGFWLNGKPYEKPLIGANRHQDFAVVGNAVANSIHWRDAKKLKDVGMEVIRNAHCPQDPAFMDACDELGLFVIVNTPGWQFWSDVPEFAQRVYSDIHHLVRRDRNHPSVWLWEPILNETWYPADFAKKTLDIVNAEYPYPSCYCGSDSEARGHEYFPVLFSHPIGAADKLDPKKTYFTREWGDNVDDWNSHNSPSRVARNWGEQPMLIQSKHYANPDYSYVCYDKLYRTTRQHIGGCLWHSFDHQRGYHPDPFYGGLMDVFRQPKYSYYMFKAQRNPQKSNIPAETGAMIYIAHEMSPFSDKDVTVYSNCDEVRLTVNKDGKTYIHKKDATQKGMPSPIITFPNAFDFMANKNLARANKQKDVFMMAEGLIDGKVVVTQKVRPALRPEKIVLSLDNEGTNLEADGSDFVTVVASVTDKDGNIKRLNNYFIQFSIEGEGRLLGGQETMTNPAPTRWGTAPVLVQSTLTPGKIKVTASVLFEGKQMPISGELELESKAASYPLIYNQDNAALIPISSTVQNQSKATKSKEKLEIERLQKELNSLKLKEVERQQEAFGEKKLDL
ncbi:MAG: glycoside hydrolase family 2 TIM barrel-domain containing protein [Bacteroidaceae bacterium]